MKLKEKVNVISKSSFERFLGEFKTCLCKFAPLKEKKRDVITASLRVQVSEKLSCYKIQPKRKFKNSKSREILRNKNRKEIIV